MRLYAAFLNLEDRKCVVVGGGPVAERKTAGLLAAGARVVVVSPQLIGRLSRWARNKRIEVRKRPYRRGDLSGATLVFAATNDRDVQRSVAAEARRAGALVNLADDPEGSGFLVPVTFQHGEVRVAISTSGASPALARFLKQRLQRALGRDYRKALNTLRRAREHARGTIPSQKDRARFLRQLTATVMTGRPRRSRGRSDEPRRVLRKFGMKTRPKR
jgi:siroheme synthase-like protein